MFRSHRDLVGQHTTAVAELEPVGKWYTGPVRPVEKFYRSGPAGKRTGWNHFSTGEIPANSGKFRRKSGKLLRQFLERK
jgi:hypothetical protein